MKILTSCSKCLSKEVCKYKGQLEAITMAMSEAMVTLSDGIISVCDNKLLDDITLRCKHETVMWCPRDTTAMTSRRNKT